MRFDRCVWRNAERREWSSRRSAAAKRAVERERSRVESARETVALFPDLQAEIQPRFDSESDRKEQMLSREDFLRDHFRSAMLRGWREARALFFSLDIHTRRGVTRFWRAGIYPASPSYLIIAIQSLTRPGCSPWTWLRKRRLCQLWAAGGLRRPEPHQEITKSFATIGSFRTARDPRVTAKRRQLWSKGIQTHF